MGAMTGEAKVYVDPRYGIFFEVGQALFDVLTRQIRNGDRLAVTNPGQRIMVVVGPREQDPQQEQENERV